MGKAGQGPEQQMITDYLRRMPWDAQVKEFEIKKPARTAALRKSQEAEKLLSAVPPGSAIIVLDEHGKALTSRQFAGKLDGFMTEGFNSVAFIIGGADGLDDSIKQKANLTMAFGSLTWPHIMVRAMLAEQIYRAWSVLNGHPYHRD